jgi:hypothetical protein
MRRLGSVFAVLAGSFAAGFLPVEAHVPSLCPATGACPLSSVTPDASIAA